MDQENGKLGKLERLQLVDVRVTSERGHDVQVVEWVCNTFPPENIGAVVVLSVITGWNVAHRITYPDRVITMRSGIRVPNIREDVE